MKEMLRNFQPDSSRLKRWKGRGPLYLQVLGTGLALFLAGCTEKPQTEDSVDGRVEIVCMGGVRYFWNGVYGGHVLTAVYEADGKISLCRGNPKTPKGGT